MNYEMRPPRRGLLPTLSPDLINHIARVEHTVFTKADCALVWRIFSDVSLWPRFCTAYKHIRWQGAPWTPGSRMHLELAEPIGVTVDRAITVCTPPGQVAWINHVRGYTMEQWISIDPSFPRGARISTWIEVTGGDPSRDRTLDMQMLKAVVEEWFENMAIECDRVVDGGDIHPAAD